jgi:putative transposase
MLLLPGATGSNATKRDGYDPGEDAGMTFEEFERTFIREICIYHLDPHDGIDGIAPAQKWAEGAATHGALLPPGLDRVELTRRFLPWKERTIHADGIHLHNCRYWHASLATRLGQKLMVHYDERTIQEVYPQIDASYVAATVVGTHPEVCKAEWEAIVAARRQLGQAYQEGGARAETARLIFANYQEVANSKIKTRQLRQSRKRQEREGTSHSVLPALPKKPPVKWVKADELGDDQWVTWLT